MRPWEKYELLEKYDTRGISAGDPFEKRPDTSSEEWERKYKAAMESGDTEALADLQALEDAYGPGDMIAGGVAGTMTAPTKGIGRFLMETAIDPLYEVAIQNARLDDAAPAIYIGRRGMSNMGIDADKDLAGQFFAMHDRQPRLEIDDRGLETTYDLDMIASPRKHYQKKAAEARAAKDEAMAAYRRGEMTREEGIQRWEEADAVENQMLDIANDYYTHGAGEAHLFDTDLPMGEVLSHPALERAVPSIRSTKYQLNTRIPDEGQGSYSESADTLKASVFSDPSTRATLAHELQHKVQGVEGLPRGGSPRGFVAETGTIRGEVLAPEAQRIFDSALRPGDSPSGAERTFRNDAAKQEAYRRLAGEVEARDAAHRMDMTPEERRRTQPYSGYAPRDGDVHPTYEKNPINIDDLIIRYGEGGGPQQMAPPVPSNQLLLRPAVNRGGKVKSAEIGKTHYDATIPEPDADASGTDQIAGFLTPEGKFLDRRQSLEWLKENDPSTFKRLDDITREKGLESQAYASAKKLKSDIQDTAAAFLRQFLGKE